VTQHLQLLADSVEHLAIVGMQRLKLRGKRVNVLKDKLFLVEGSHDVGHVERPPACVNLAFLRPPRTT
jgi:hypothetical protein